jgi:replicative DNA helicase
VTELRPLHSLDAERAVLGGIINQPHQWHAAVAALSGEMFFRRAHQMLWRTIAGLVDRKVPLDLVVLCDALTQAGTLDEVGGPAYVASVIDYGLAANVATYAAIVRRFATLRDLERAARQVLASVREDDDVEDLLERAERAVLAVRQSLSRRADFVLAEDWMMEVAGHVEQALATKRAITGVPTAIPTLDRWTRGLQPSDLIFIGARPSTGKTALALQLALEASRHVMTGFVSIEMSRKQIGFRAVSLEAQVDNFRLMVGAVNQQEQQAIGRALSLLAERRLAIDDASGQTPTELRAKVRRLAAQHGLGAVFIDYMQLLRETKPVENRNQEIGIISGGLKDLAKELDVPVVVLSQLSRDSAKANRRPQLHDLRDGGALEQDADVVLLLHRPGQLTDDDQDRDGDRGDRYRDGEPAEVIVAKQRNGPTGIIKVRWQARQMRFVEEAPAGVGVPA